MTDLELYSWRRKLELLKSKRKLELNKKFLSRSADSNTYAHHHDTDIPIFEGKKRTPRDIVKLHWPSTIEQETKLTSGRSSNNELSRSSTFYHQRHVPECLDTFSEFFDPSVSAEKRFEKYLSETKFQDLKDFRNLPKQTVPLVSTNNKKAKPLNTVAKIGHLKSRHHLPAIDSKTSLSCDGNKMQMDASHHKTLMSPSDYLLTRKIPEKNGFKVTVGSNSVVLSRSSPYSNGWH